MPTVNTAGRVKATLALHPATYEYLRSHALSPRALSEVVDDLVREKRLLEPVEKRIRALERRIKSLTAK